MDIAKVFEIISTLRHPETGCPWDREQRLSDLIKPLRSEVEELAKALENNDREHIREELGDVFFNVCQIMAVAEEDGLFNPNEPVEEVLAKMIRRHPHVFGEEKARDAEHAAEIYKQAKAGEKK